MAYTQLVHVVQWLPVLSIYIEEVDLAISVSVLTTDQQDLIWRNRKSTASPEWVLHSHCEYLPQILLDFIELDAVIDFLLSASEKSTKGVDGLIAYGAGTQVMSLILHGSHLSPFVFADIILLDGAKSLLAGESSKDKH